MASKNPKHINDLKGASYNPRYITDKKLKALTKSMEEFGDLSGVVFNRTTGVLVSGHQRIKSIKGKSSKISKSVVKKDRQGTVALGTIDVKEDDGTITKIPYREVEWDNKLHEMAANVSANASGGDFDQAKLGAVMAKLEKGEFDVELTSVDNWTTAKAIGRFKKSKDENSEGSQSDDDNSFSVVDPKAMAFDHQCPKCGYKYSASTSKPKSPPPVKSSSKAPAKKVVKKKATKK